MAADFRKTPSLYLTGNSNEMKVVWQLDGDPSGTVSISYCPSESFWNGFCFVDQSVQPASNDHVYDYVVTNQWTNTNLRYEILLDGHRADGTFEMPPPVDTPTLSFYALGDCRSHPETLANVLGAVEKDMDGHPERQTFCLHSGDWTVNGEKEESWDSEWFRHDAQQEHFRANMPITGTQGNHDNGPLYRKYLRMNFPSPDATYNAFDYGPVRIINLDQCAWLRAGDKQYNWITNELVTHTNKHLIFCFHAPGYSTGHQANNRTVQNVLQPLFERYGIQLVICGHNHNYTRAVTGGVNHVTTGGAGAPIFPGNSNAPGVVTTEPVNNFLRVDINGSTGTVTAFRTNLSVIESFTFVKPVLHYPIEPVKLPGDEPTPTVSVPMVGKNYKGKPSRVDWSKAVQMPISRDIWGFPFTNRESTIQMIQDGKYLYLRLRETADYRKLANAGYSGDHWELFFAPTRGEPYRQVSITPDGKLDFHSMGETDDINHWHKSIRLNMAKRDQEHWDLQLSIPLADFSASGIKPGDRVYMNIFRGAAADKPSTAWSPTFSDSFHNILRFGEITLAQTPAP